MRWCGRSALKKKRQEREKKKREKRAFEYLGFKTLFFFKKRMGSVLSSFFEREFSRRPKRFVRPPKKEKRREEKRREEREREMHPQTDKRRRAKKKEIQNEKKIQQPDSLRNGRYIFRFQLSSKK